MLDIQTILESKPHNPHYLKRYVKFIEYCRRQSYDGHTERHHICPKAKDLFPEHKDATWNYVDMSARHHIFAHVLLWKAFKGSQATALDAMLGKFNSSTNHRLKHRIVPPSYIIRYLAKTREDAGIRKGVLHKGKAVYKNSEGDKFYLDIDDPQIQAQNLVGILKGHTMSEDSREKMRGDRVTKLFYKGSLEIKTLRHNDPNFEETFQSHLRLGWELERSDENRAQVKAEQYTAVSEKAKGKIAMYFPSGTFYGRIPKDSPAIKDLGLVHIRSKKQSEQALIAAKNAQAANLGSEIYNDGKSERKFKSTPEDPKWKLGRLPRSESHIENQRRAVSSRVGGSTTWNDGLRNYRVPAGKFPDPSWTRGMVPRKKET